MIKLFQAVLSSLFMTLVVHITATAQSVEMVTLSTASFQASVGKASLTSTLGQPMTLTIGNSTNAFFTQGFEQPASGKVNAIEQGPDNSSGPIVFPNPATEVIYLKTDLVGTVNIYNTQGALVISKNHLPNSARGLEISALTKGLYLVVFDSNSEKSYSTKFIKQ